MDKPKTCPNVESGDGPRGPESACLLPITERQAEVEDGPQPLKLVHLFRGPKVPRCR